MTNIWSILVNDAQRGDIGGSESVIGPERVLSVIKSGLIGQLDLFDRLFQFLGISSGFDINVGRFILTQLKRN